jgi:hypothetical protein
MNLYKTTINDLVGTNLNFYTLSGGKDGDYYSFASNNAGTLVLNIPNGVALIFTDTNMPATKANIIRRFYSIDDEFNVLNKGIDDKTNVEYTTYKLLINSL